MKSMKKIILASTMALIICSTSVINVVAQENQPSINIIELDNTGVSYEIPELNDNNIIDTRSTSKPNSSKVWNISQNGRYNFGGESAYTTLYTNYNFTGKSSYRLYIKNTGNSAITMTARRNSLIPKTYASTKVSAGKTAIIEFSNIERDTKFYVDFYGGGSRYIFNGYVE